MNMEINIAAETQVKLLPTCWGDIRRFPRFIYRNEVSANICPLPVAERNLTQNQTILTCDLSRGGFNFQHSEQLFPGEQVELLLSDGSSFRGEVLWCRRIGEGEYSHGCRFIKAEPARSSADETDSCDPTAI